MSIAADRLQEFLDKIDNYISCQNISSPRFNEEFAVAETFDTETLSLLTQDECFNYAYMLYQYADHVASERSKQENVVRWCESSLNSILAQEMDNQEIAKYEIKVARVLFENELAKKIDEWKKHAESRLAKLVSREYNIRRKADILIEKGKRK